MVSQQLRAWSDCIDVKAGLALYWWQRQTTFATSRQRVKFYTFKVREQSGKYLEFLDIIINYFITFHSLNLQTLIKEVYNKAFFYNKNALITNIFC
jgi:hypothetical protein